MPVLRSVLRTAPVLSFVRLLVPVSFKDIPRIIRLGTDAEFYSGKFQWLPSDFEISEDGTDVRILSYINNLHPKTHSAAYKTISKIFAKFVPLFESTLTRMKADELIPVQIPLSAYALAILVCYVLRSGFMCDDLYAHLMQCPVLTYRTAFGYLARRMRCGAGIDRACFLGSDAR
eukprot:2429955-Rhodomonas_salina.3